MLDIENSFAKSIGKGVLSNCEITSLGGLVVNISGGEAFYAGGHVSVPEKELTLVNNTTNHIYCITNYNTSTRFYEADVISNTTGSNPTNSLKLGKVITSGGNVTSIDVSGVYPLLTLENISERIALGTLGSGGGGGSFSGVLPTGSLSGQIPVIQSTGKLLPSVIPVIDIVNVYPVSGIANMLALSQASSGDISVVSSTNQTFILSHPPASVSGNWIEIKTPGGGVTSVNGKTGIVSLVASDITGFGSAANASTGTVQGTIPVLGLSGLLNTNTIPVVPVIKGGTGFSSYTRGDMFYADSSTTFTKFSGPTTANSVLGSYFNGSFSEPRWLDVLPIHSGGTGQSSINPGELFVGDYGNTSAKLSAPTSNEVYLSAQFNSSWYEPRWKPVSGIVSSSSSSFIWQEVTSNATSQVNYGYIVNSSSLVTLTLPTTAVVGSTIKVVGVGTGGWKVSQNSGQQINMGATFSTSGTSGYVSSTHYTNTIELVCVAENTKWAIISNIGLISLT
jgi:hypothetical protein